MRPANIHAVLVIVAALMLAVAFSIVAMPGEARTTLADFVRTAHDRASAAGAPMFLLRLLSNPDRVVGALRIVGVLYAVAAAVVLVYAIT